MSDKPDGGPAFPDAVAVGPSDDLYGSISHGLTKREWFAGQVMVGLLPGHEAMLDLTAADIEDMSRVLAVNAFFIADAMLEESRK